MGAQLQSCGRICGDSSIKVTPKAVPAFLKEWAETARPKGTPVLDEGFICMGGTAPLCPPPPPKLASGPITIDTLQGEWIGSGGSKITVLGTDVAINGLPLKAHKVTLRDDGTVLSIGSLWQLGGWHSSGGLEFRASSTQENMECARSEVWTRRSEADAGWSERMRLLGYAGSSASPLERGVEGCIPGTDGADMPAGYSASKDARDVSLLCALVTQWREDAPCRVKSRQVVPDFTNRSQTGLGVELMHFIAGSMRQKGFMKREGTKGHDIPVVVREPPNSEFQAEALAVWKSRVAAEGGFPPVRANADEEIFTSLGNGHFFQALNCFACGVKAINADYRYDIGKDQDLQEAISDGVWSIVLKQSTPRPVRAKIADLLNSKREFKWNLNSDGTVDISNMEEDTGHCSQFEWLSKGMDAVQVDCLVRTHLGIKNSKRIQG